MQSKHFRNTHTTTMPTSVTALLEYRRTALTTFTATSCCPCVDDAVGCADPLVGGARFGCMSTHSMTFPNVPMPSCRFTTYRDPKISFSLSS